MDQILAEARTRIMTSVEGSRPSHRISNTNPLPPPAAPPGEISDPEEDPHLAHFLMCPVHLREYNTTDHLPHLIFPCGHTVCREACVRETRCPLCRTNFRNHCLNRGLVEVMHTINAPISEGIPKMSDNHFLQELNINKKVIERLSPINANITISFALHYNRIKNNLSDEDEETK